jgi:glycosyltransferase involved in cell wall biosynthesis
MKKILFIHSEKKQKYGAHYINELTIEKLRKKGYSVDVICPTESINLMSSDMQGISNILFYYSLIQKYKQCQKYDVVQGTTYTPLAFIGNGAKVISHFGSTTWGFLKNVPSHRKLERENSELCTILQSLKENNIISSVHGFTKPLKDISKIELYVARKSDIVIATSKKVRQELIHNKVPPDKIRIIYNAIEDYWFTGRVRKKPKQHAALVYIGRIGDEPFTIKLKGVSRLLYILKNCPSMEKVIIAMCSKVNRYEILFRQILNTTPHLSVEKRKIPNLLKGHYADIYINASRYEGFCLSMVEAMSRGLVPIVFPFGLAPEIIVDGKNGYIVRSLDEMLERIRRIRDRPEKRAAMAVEAMKTARQFDSDTMIRNYHKLYKSL